MKTSSIALFIIAAIAASANGELFPEAQEQVVADADDMEVRFRSLKAKSTKAPTIKSTKAPTIKSTKAPTIKSTKAPTIKSTKAPTVKSRRELV